MVLRFKQFSGSGEELEHAVNKWLAEFEPDVNHMSQTTREDGTIVLCFVFQESFRGQELRLSSEAQATNPQPSTAAGTRKDTPLKVRSERS